MGLLAVNAVGVLILLAAAEVLLAIIDPPQSAPYSVHPPDISIAVKVDPRVTRGVQGNALFETNPLGLRGPMPSADDRIRILALGGSTTECLVLSLEESWPWRLGRLLSERTGSGVWVGNAGKSGRNSRQHYFDARYVAPGLGRLDAALLMVGINDLFNRMIQGESFEPADVVALNEDGSYIRSALHVSGEAEGGFESRHLVRRGRRALEWLELLSPQERETRYFLDHSLPGFYTGARRMRAAGRPLDVIPPMDAALAEFERNLSLILDSLEAHGAIPIVVTQPAMWRPDLTPEEAESLWLGSADGWPPRVEGGPYYTVRVMEQLLDRYNGSLRGLAQRRGVDLVDLAELMRVDLQTCYDDVHFNEEGSRRVAEVLADKLLAGAALRKLR